MANQKCLPNIPWPRWALEAGLSGGEKDHENWRYLEKWAQRIFDEGCAAAGGLGSEVYCASWNGLLVSGPRTGRYYAPGINISLTGFITSLITAGSTTTSIRILRGTGTGNPSAVKTISLGTGVAYQTDSGPIAVNNGQYFQVEIQSAGSGAIGMLCQIAIAEVV